MLVNILCYIVISDFSKSLKDTSGLSSQIAAGKQTIKVCSSFAALSGNTDSGVGFKQMLNVSFTFVNAIAMTMMNTGRERLIRTWLIRSST